MLTYVGFLEAVVRSDSGEILANQETSLTSLPLRGMGVKPHALLSRVVWKINKWEGSGGFAKCGICKLMVHHRALLAWRVKATASWWYWLAHSELSSAQDAPLCPFFIVSPLTYTSTGNHMSVVTSQGGCHFHQLLQGQPEAQGAAGGGGEWGYLEEAEVVWMQSCHS